MNIKRLPLLALIVLMPCLAFADTTITYQGQLQDTSGPHTGTPDMVFRLFDSLTDGNQVGPTIERQEVPVEEGMFRVDLDFGDAYDGMRWIEVEVEGSTLSPRQRIAPVPLAVRALSQEGVWEQFDNDAVYTAGNVGVGTNLPGVPLQVVGALVSGELHNLAAENAFASGGTENSPNVAGGVISFVGGGEGNHASEHASFVGGGSENKAGNFWSFVGGGLRNVASGRASYVAGGQDNKAIGDGSFVTGAFNDSSGVHSFVSGKDNKATGYRSFVGGGKDNEASGTRAFVSGTDNLASGTDSFVGGGVNNEAGGWGGFVAGGVGNVAGGNMSFAGGRSARAMHTATFVWADNAVGTFTSTGNAQFLVRAGGGMGINTTSPSRELHIAQQTTDASANGLALENTDGNEWGFYVAVSDNLGFRYNNDLVARIDTEGEFATLSDARYKTEIEPLQSALEQTLRLQPSSYRFKDRAEDRAPRFGLIAQEVRDVVPSAVSEVEGTLGISYSQITALNTAAIGELHELASGELAELRAVNAELLAANAELRAEIAVLKDQSEKMRELADRNAELEDRLAKLESLLLEDRQVAKGLR